MEPFAFTFAERGLNPLERTAVDILMCEIADQHHRGIQLRQMMVNEHRTPDALAICLILWVKATDEIIHFDREAVEADYKDAMEEERRYPGADFQSCSRWSLAVIRNVLIDRDPDALLALVRELGALDVPGRWIEALLGSLSDMCRQALAARRHGSWLN